MCLKPYFVKGPHKTPNKLPMQKHHQTLLYHQIDSSSSTLPNEKSSQNCTNSSDTDQIYTVGESHLSIIQLMAWLMEKPVRLLGINLYKGDKEQDFCLSHPILLNEFSRKQHLFTLLKRFKVNYFECHNEFSPLLVQIIVNCFS